MGFVGCVALLALYAALLAWLGLMAMRCRSQFCRLVIAGAGAALFASVAVNIGMVTGAVPVVGVPLPLMSYGGSAMMTAMLLIGILLSIDRQREETSAAAMPPAAVAALWRPWRQLRLA